MDHTCITSLSVTQNTEVEYALGKIRKHSWFMKDLYQKGALLSQNESRASKLGRCLQILMLIICMKFKGNSICTSLDVYISLNL